MAASRVSRSSLFRRRRRSWPLARSVRLLHFNPEIFPRLRARVCVASVVRPHPQSATSQRYDVRVFLPPFHDSMCARGRAARGAGGGGENSHVKTVGERNLEEERKRRGPPAAAATAPPPFPIAPSLLPVQVPRALSSENMTTIISAVLERGGGGGEEEARRAGGGEVGSCERT